MDISFNGNNIEYNLSYIEDKYILKKRPNGKKSFELVGTYSKLEYVLDQAFFLELSDSSSHSFADVYAAIEEAKEFIGEVASKINETALKQP